MNRYLAALLLAAIIASPGFAQVQDSTPAPKSAASKFAGPKFAGPKFAGPKFTGPTRDVTYHVVLLIESDDQNRLPYAGPARDGLTEAGYDRLVIAGSATAIVSTGQSSEVSGTSRYGQLSVSNSMLNTTEKDEVQIKVKLQTKNQSPIMIETTARVPLGRWFLVGAADSRVGLPKHADDGKRSVAGMRIDAGVQTLD